MNLSHKGNDTDRVSDERTIRLHTQQFAGLSLSAGQTHRCFTSSISQSVPSVVINIALIFKTS